MALWLKNVPTIFSLVVVIAFKDFIQNFLQVYMDDWTVYGLIRDHLDNLWLMLEICRQYQIALNSKKCIFCALFGMLLGCIICKQLLLVDPAKITLILSLPLPTNVNILRATLGNTGYYRKIYKRVCVIRNITPSANRSCSSGMNGSNT